MKNLKPEKNQSECFVCKAAEDGEFLIMFYSHLFCLSRNITQVLSFLRRPIYLQHCTHTHTALLSCPWLSNNTEAYTSVGHSVQFSLLAKDTPQMGLQLYMLQVCSAMPPYWKACISSCVITMNNTNITMHTDNTTHHILLTTGRPNFISYFGPSLKAKSKNLVLAI